VRLQLIFVAVAASAAHADPEGDTATVVARTSGYLDNDHTAISTSTVAVRAKPKDELVVSAHYVADAVSSASVDVVSAATKRWTELRSEVQGGLAYVGSALTVSADYIFSHENDWDSHTVSLAVSRDFFHHNLTLGVGGSYVDNRVGRADDMNFHETMRVGAGSLRAVWVATKTDIFQASYDLGRANGYQASPYRYAFVADSTGVPIGHPENVPELRTRHSATLRWNHHLLEDAALRSHARVYVDDWGVRSLTAGSEFVVGLEPWELAASVRVYAQQHAEFYQDLYDQPRVFMTADRELSTFQDVFAGVRARWSHEDTLAFDASLTGFAFRFPEFARLPSRLGLVAAIGVVWPL
jgi:uncharacterized protein DUF3570